MSQWRISTLMLQVETTSLMFGPLGVAHMLHFSVLDQNSDGFKTFGASLVAGSFAFFCSESCKVRKWASGLCAQWVFLLFKNVHTNCTPFMQHFVDTFYPKHWIQCFLDQHNSSKIKQKRTSPIATWKNTSKQTLLNLECFQKRFGWCSVEGEKGAKIGRILNTEFSVLKILIVCWLAMDTKAVEMQKKTLGALETNVASFTAHDTASFWVFGAHFVPLLLVP